jgi:hypothetical protein
MATADYWDTADLKALGRGGLVSEDVMAKIWNISNFPLPFTDKIGSGSAKNSYHEWTTDAHPTPNLTNAVVSGSDSAGNNAAGGARVGNHCQNSVKNVQVTHRARNTQQFGRSDEFAYQLMMRQIDLRRDIEAIALTQQGSIADDGDAIAGKAGCVGAWLTSNVSRGATGANGGFSTVTGLVTAPTAGTVRALSWTTLEAVMSSIYVAGGECSVAMTTPTLMRELAKYLLTASTNIAKPTAQVSGTERVEQVAQGYVNVLIGAYGQTVELVPNRLQPTVAATNVNLYLLDTNVLALDYLQGYRTDPLGKNGLSDRSEISVDWTLKVGTEKACGVVADINPTLAVVA